MWCCDILLWNGTHILKSGGFGFEVQCTMCTMPLYGSSCSSIATNNAPKDKLSYYISFNGLVYVVGHFAGAPPCPLPVVFICPELKKLWDEFLVFSVLKIRCMVIGEVMTWRYFLGMSMELSWPSYLRRTYLTRKVQVWALILDLLYNQVEVSSSRVYIQKEKKNPCMMYLCININFYENRPKRCFLHCFVCVQSQICYSS